MHENERTIREFIEAWSHLEPAQLASYFAGDSSVDLPCTGVFELESGKIKVWRDYFDFATYQRGFA